MVLGGHRYLTFAALAENREWLVGTVARSGRGALVFILAYAGLVALSFPGAELLTIAGGFLFGPWLGTAYAVIGATSARPSCSSPPAPGWPGCRARRPVGRAGSRPGFARTRSTICWCCVWFRSSRSGWSIWSPARSGMRLSVYVLAHLHRHDPGHLRLCQPRQRPRQLVAEGRHPDLAILFRPSMLLPILGLAVLALLPVVYKRWRAAPGASRHERRSPPISASSAPAPAGSRSRRARRRWARASS